jgi:hypothetical protein
VSIQPLRTNIFEIKQGDTGPRIETTLLDGDGVPVDLTDAVSVRFKMVAKAHPHAVKLNRVTAGFNPTTAGEVWYQWAAGNTDTPGSYTIDWQVTFPGAIIMTFPSHTFDEVKVIAAH